MLTAKTGKDGYIVVRQGVESDVTAIAAPVKVGHRVVASHSSVIPSYRLNSDQVARIGALLVSEASSIIAPPGAVHSLEEETPA